MGMIKLLNCAVLTLVSLLMASGVSSNERGSLAPTTGTKARDTDQHAKTAPSSYLKLPVFQHSRLPTVNKDHFSPGRGTGHEQLPDKVRDVLFAVATTPTVASTFTDPPVITSCNTNKMRVQVKKMVLGSSGSASQITLGTCKANKTTGDSIYFEHDFGMCGTKRTMVDNRVAYSNTLKYDPPNLPGPIRRAVPFTWPVVCHFNRYHYSYKIGYIPTIQVRKLFKPMKNSAHFTLTPRNDKWERLAPDDGYVLGRPMYFEAQAPSMSNGDRLYLHACHVTAERSHTSTPQFPVIENFGCMVESKTSGSRFIQSSQKRVVRFTVDAFLFEGMPGQRLHMHCSMSVDSADPSPTTKACNYDRRTARWVELYGPASVCSCCDSPKCTSDASSAAEMVTSRPWSVKYSAKSASPATDVMTPTAQPEEKDVRKVGNGTEVRLEGPQREVRVLEGPQREVRVLEGPQREVRVLGGPQREVRVLEGPQREVRVLEGPQREVRVLEGPQRGVKKLGRPLGGVKEVKVLGGPQRGVKKLEVEAGGRPVKKLEVEAGRRPVKKLEVEAGRRPVKGFAVVKEEQITEPRRTFEEIFGLSK